MKVTTYEAIPGEVKKCVLLYSGGLDTSVMIRWIQENYGAEVITLTVDVGQKGKDLEKVKEKALKLGATQAFIIDAKKEFANEYVARAIKANALYEGEYPLSSALSRPLLAKWAVKIAEKVGADTIAHGCSGKGNDQVRFDITITSMNPKMKVIAPVREWNLSREEEIEYAKKNGIPIPVDINRPYSIDENLWGRSIECGELEYPEKEPPEEVFEWCLPLNKTPNEPEYVELEFKEGIPVALNGKEMELWELISKLNEIGGKHGVGIIDHMEDRIVGLKSREVYEAPAATIIIKAHKELEKLVCTIHENWFKPLIDKKWSELVYSGLWVEPLREELETFINAINQKVNGKVKLKLFKGSVRIVARESSNALYDLKLATYEKGQLFNQKASPGFIEIFGLQTKMAYQVFKKWKGSGKED